MDIEPYVSLLIANNWSPDTIKAYRSDLKFFEQFLESQNMRITQVTPVVVGKFVESMRSRPNPRFGKMGLSQTTIQRRLAVISGFFDFLRTTSNPRLKNPVRIFTRHSRRPRKSDPVDQALDVVTLNKLLGGIDNARDRAIIWLFVTSGLRLSELYQLDVDSIQIVEEETTPGTKSVWGTGKVIGKGSKERAFFFSEEAISAIRKYLGTRTDDHPALFLSERKERLSRRAIQDLVAAWCLRLGLGRIHAHQFRHTFCTRLASAHIDAMVLKDLMGHSHFDTTTKYFKLSEETCAREYFAAMEFARGPQP